jgi:hypothetical protein
MPSKNLDLKWTNFHIPHDQTDWPRHQNDQGDQPMEKDRYPCIRTFLHFAYLTIFHLTSSLSLESFVPLNEVIETLECLKNLTLVDLNDAC